MLPLYRTRTIRPDYLFSDLQPPIWSPAQHEALTKLRDWYGATHGLLASEEIRRLAWCRYLLAHGQMGGD